MAACGLLDGAAAGHGLWDRPDGGWHRAPLTLQAATEWWFACLILTFSLLAVFCFSSHSCPLSLLSTLPTVVCYVFESRFCFFFVWVLRIMLTHLLFVFFFFLFPRLPQQAFHAAAPNWSWQGEKEARGSGDLQTRVKHRRLERM